MCSNKRRVTTKGEHSRFESRVKCGVLLTGDNGAVLSCLLNRLAVKTEKNIYCITAARERSRKRLAGYLKSLKYSSKLQGIVKNRVHFIRGDVSEPWLGMSEDDIRLLKTAKIEEVWDTDECFIFDPSYSETFVSKSIRRNENLLKAACDLDVAIINYIRTGYAGKSISRDCNSWFLEGKRIAEQIIRKAVKFEQAKVRIFRTPEVIGDNVTAGRNDYSVFYRFLYDLKQFTEWVNTREDKYFGNAPLSLYSGLPADSAVINVVHADTVVQDILDIQAKEAVTQTDRYIGYGKRVEFADLASVIKDICPSFRLRLVSEFSRLNVLDRMFDDRILPYAWSLIDGRGGGVSPERPVNAAGDPVIDITAKYLNQINVENIRNETEQDTVFNMLTPVSFERENGQITRYFKMGTGDIIVLNNTVGASIDLWKKMFPFFHQKYKILAWECRGIKNKDYTDDSMTVISEIDRVQDIERIFENERIDSAHLVGFSSGAKDILTFYYNNKNRVKSLIFITTPFLLAHTEFSATVRSMCRTVADKPGLARFYINFFADPVNYSFEESDINAIADQIISQIGSRNRSILRMTENIEFFINYCKIYAEGSSGFPLYGSIDEIDDVTVPVLIISGQYDRLVHKKQTEMVMQKLENAMYHEVKGASHWLPLENEREIGPVITNFIERLG